ncbi:phospholipid/cholesterol/gamma-HCH transport system substrate-binding protein [Mycolicibacterium rutilum]|uniref:Phospholipid/cholesterol/gamma-HCH transport system substrate-binding protein n=1 Tax=Mycolicibacterium rutilum TaxID=370526 RepID=A0A1H6LJL9_MYCRU|nr:MCE family protein [Mycolicibacterium rutilum]SEH86299.1 phospholipid/cholesterol/gamma-HCH transport system substrate-binding protein [Mycolicibacterium rutilum]
MRRSLRPTLVKFGVFAAVMTMLTASLFFIFGQYQTGSTKGYSAVFADVSRLEAGQSVRVGGMRVGTVDSVKLQPDKTVVVHFDADPTVQMTTGTRAAVRYLNLVGDRYLELMEGPGGTPMPAGGQIPRDRTQSALDLDLLLGGLKPVIRGLNPEDVNALSASLIQIFQGQGGTLRSLLTNTSGFTSALAEHNQTIQALIDNLRTLLATLNREGEKFSGTIDKLETLVTELAAERDPIGTAIDALNDGTASVADLLSDARSPLADTVDELNRLAPNLDLQKDRIDTGLQKAPENYRKLIRTGAYGSFFNYYICELKWRVTDLQGRTAVFPWVRQENGRCSEP